MSTGDFVAQALDRAAQDPGRAPELHGLLADRPLLVPVSRLRPDPAGPEVTAIMLWRDPSDGQPFVPLFTMPARIPDGASPEVMFVWDTLKRLSDVLPQAHFRINPAGPVMFDLPQALVRTIVGSIAAPLAPASIAQGTDLGIGPPTGDHSVLVSALRSHFSRQPTAPAIYLYELFRPDGSLLAHSLVIGVVGGYELSVAADIAAIVPEAYSGPLPVDIGFVGGHPEIVEALTRLSIEPAVEARSAQPPQ